MDQKCTYPLFRSRVAAKLLPGGERLEWEVLDRDEIPTLCLSGIVGFNIELCGDQTWHSYTLSLESRRDVRSYLDENQIAYEQVWVDIADQLLVALRGISGVEVRSTEQASAEYEASLTDEDRYWMSPEGRLKGRQNRIHDMAVRDEWEREPEYSRWEALGYQRRVELINQFIESMNPPFIEEFEEFISAQAGISANEIPVEYYLS